MPLTTAQKQSLKTDITNNTVTVTFNGSSVQINALPNSPDGNQAVADWYNGTHSPDYWVWRTLVTKAEYTQTTSVDATNFNWTGNGFITRAAGEQAAWREMFNGADAVNPSLPNVRQAFTDIFSGTGNAAANRTHLSTISRRKATRAEELFATGTGSTGSPALMGFEGAITGIDVLDARNS